MRISRPIALALSAAVHAMTVLAAEPADWKFVQDVPVAASGLIRLHLPLETIDAARLGLEDLRVFDRLGTEIPYLVESALPSDRRPHRARSFRPGLAGTATMLEIETGVPEPIEGVALETFATQFIKPVSVEGSEDRVNWKILAQGQPIFRQPNGPSQLQIAFAPQAWTWLRVTIDDRRSAPVPFTGATVLAVASEPSTETLTATIADRTELPGQTRLLLHLPAAGLRLAGLHLDTPDPLFTRHITISSRQVMENSIRETSVATGSIYRLATEGFSDSSNTFVRVETVMPTRELLLLIDNQDSPPLQIQAVRARRRPVSIVFFTPTNGVFKLYSGNRQRPAPQYDLARLSTSLKSAATTVVPASGLTNNPGYRPAEAMPTVSGIGPVPEVQE